MIDLTATERAQVRDCTDPIYYIGIARGSATWPGSPTYHFYAHREVPRTGDGGCVYYEDRMDIKSITDAKQGADSTRLGGFSLAGSMAFMIRDDDKHYIGLNDLGIYYNGHTVTMWLNYDPAATTYSVSDVLLWTGYITEMERDLLDGTIRFRCEGLGERTKKDIPPNVYETDNSDYPSSRGTPVPMVLGHHEAAKAIKIADAGNNGSVDHGPAYQCTDDQVGTIGTITNVRFGDGGLVDASGGFATIIISESPYVIDAAGKIYFTNLNDMNLYAYVDISVHGYLLDQTHIGADADVQSPKMVDDKDNTYAFWFVMPGSPISNVTYCFKIPIIGTPGTIVEQPAGHPYLLLAAKFATVTISPPAIAWDCIIFWAPEEGQAVSLDNADNIESAMSENDIVDLTFETTTVGFGTGAGTYSDCDTLQKLGSGYLYLGLSITAPAFGSCYISFYELRGIRVRCYFDYPGDTGIYADVEGYLDDGAGTITGTPDALIEHPAHVVSWLLFVSGINARHNNFQDVATEYLGGMEVARQITDATTTLDVIDSLAQEAGFVVRFDRYGYADIYTLDTRSGGSNITISESQVVGGRMKSAKQTPIKDVVTSFIFRYKYNHLIDDYEQTMYCTSSTCSTAIPSTSVTLCAEAEEKYTAGRVVEKTYDLAWCRDAATAGILAGRIIKQFTTRPWWLELELDMEMIYIEEGDAIEFGPGQFSWWPSELLNSQYIVTEVTHHPDKHGLTIKAHQVI